MTPPLARPVSPKIEIRTAEHTLAMCADVSDRLPLVLMPGMGADRRLFESQAADLPWLIAPEWITAEADESLTGYAKRMAAAVDPGKPCLIGGCSFGGIVAIEMARHLDARACLLISSIRSSDELPLRVRILRPVAFAAPRWFAALLPKLAGLLEAAVGRLLGPTNRSALRQFAESDGQFVRWAARALFRWQTRGEPPIPVAQIQGGRDRVLPVHTTRPDVVVPGGGHLLPLTHPAAVSDFLRSQRQKHLDADRFRPA